MSVSALLLGATAAIAQTTSYPADLTSTSHFFEHGWVIVGNNTDMVVAIHPTSSVRHDHMLEVGLAIGTRLSIDANNGLGEFDYAVANVRVNCGSGVIGSRLFALLALNGEPRGSNDEAAPLLPLLGSPMSAVAFRGCHPELTSNLIQFDSAADVVSFARSSWASDPDADLAD